MIPRRRGSRETVRLGRVVPGRPGVCPGVIPGLFHWPRLSGGEGRNPPRTPVQKRRLRLGASLGALAILVAAPARAAPPPPGYFSPPLLGFAQSALPPAPSHGARERPSKNVCRGRHSSARDPLAPCRRPSPAPAVFRDVSWTPSFEPQRAWVMSCLGPSCRGGYEHCFPAHASVGCRTENRSLGNLL